MIRPVGVLDVLSNVGLLGLADDAAASAQPLPKEPEQRLLLLVLVEHCLLLAQRYLSTGSSPHARETSSSAVRLPSVPAPTESPPLGWRRRRLVMPLPQRLPPQARSSSHRRARRKRGPWRSRGAATRSARGCGCGSGRVYRSFCRAL